MTVITSPYLRLRRKINNRYVLINYLTDKVDVITQEQYKMLDTLRIETDIDETSELYINEMKEKRLLAANRVWSYHRVNRVEIEVISQCNWKCVYCPNAYINRSRKVMSMKEFCLILDKCKNYGSISTVCLHVFNEPTIDPFFHDRVIEIKRRGFQMELFTNASQLTVDKLQLLESMGNVKRIVCHFPSYYPDTFKQLTGTSDYYKTIRNIQNACHYNIPVHVSIHYTEKLMQKEGEFQHSKMKELFPFAIIDWIPIQDRAGTLLNPEYNKHINLDLLHLSGCFYFCQILYISVEGFCFTCINDSLSLNNVYGNIFDMEVKELLENKKAVELRKLIFGGSRAPKEFICQKCVFMKESIQKYQEMWRDV